MLSAGGVIGLSGLWRNAATMRAMALLGGCDGLLQLKWRTGSARWLHGTGSKMLSTSVGTLKEQEEGDGQRGRGGAARRRCVLLRLALALWRGQLYRLADACAR